MNHNSDDLQSLKNRPAPRRQSEVTGNVRLALNQGRIESKNLVEWLCVDRLALLHSLNQSLNWNLELSTKKDLAPLAPLSKLQQSKQIAKLLAAQINPTDQRFQQLQSHPSDVAREWAALIIGSWPEMPFQRRLAWMKPLADDANASTREIAWIALREHVIDDPANAINRLIPWTGSRNDRLRRYASEITRPRGVWCRHCPTLIENPSLALPLLTPLRSDDSLYVRNSVANWLNDASKSQPLWVQQLSSLWLNESPTPETNYIVRRALRTLLKSNQTSPLHQTRLTKT